MGFSFDLAEEEKSFEAPTLIIAARQDLTVGYRDAWDILESYPRAPFAVLDRADHVWPIETPNLLAALVEDWLARIALAERAAGSDFQDFARGPRRSGSAHRVDE